MVRKFKVPGVYVEETSMVPKALDAAGTSVTAFIGMTEQGPMNEALEINTLAGFEKTFGDASGKSTLPHAVRQFFENGGQRAIIVRVADRGFAEPALSIQKQGLWALDQVESFNLLAIPPFARGEDLDPRSLRTALAYCKQRRAMLLLDPRSDWLLPVSILNPETGIDSLGLRDPNAVLYYPNIVFPDPSNGGKPAGFAPCGAMAGLIARTDAAEGVWTAPAGLHATITGAVKLERDISVAQNRLLNQAGINCLRNFRRTGVVCWGARTLDGADSLGSEWKYLPVRRLALLIEETLHRGLGWVVFEPNGEPLWANISESIEDFLFSLFREGAFQGSTLNEAFFVRCDETTNSEADIDAGEVNIQLGFAPVRPAEFVILTFRLKTGSDPV